MPRRLRMASVLAAALFSFSLAGAAPAAAGNICEKEMEQASAKYGVPLGILYAVGLTETGRKGSLQPYAMNIEGKPFFGKSKADAMQRFALAKREGKKLVDLGCMQINHYYHAEKFS